MLIAQISDVHVGGARYREELLDRAIEEVNAAEPELVVVAGDLTDDGYPDQYPLAKQELSALACPQIVRVPGNTMLATSATSTTRTRSARATRASGSRATAST